MDGWRVVSMMSCSGVCLFASALVRRGAVPWRGVRLFASVRVRCEFMVLAAARLCRLVWATCCIWRSVRRGYFSTKFGAREPFFAGSLLRTVQSVVTCSRW